MIGKPLEPIFFTNFLPGQPRVVLSFHHPNNKLLTKIWRKQNHFCRPFTFLSLRFVFFLFLPQFQIHPLLPLKPPSPLPLLLPSDFASTSPHLAAAAAAPAPAFLRWQIYRLFPHSSPRSPSCASSCSPRRRPRSPAPRQATPATAARYTSCWPITASPAACSRAAWSRTPWTSPTGCWRRGCRRPATRRTTTATWPTSTPWCAATSASARSAAWRGWRRRSSSCGSPSRASSSTTTNRGSSCSTSGTRTRASPSLSSRTRRTVSRRPPARWEPLRLPGGRQERVFLGWGSEGERKGETAAGRTSGERACT